MILKQKQAFSSQSSHSYAMFGRSFPFTKMASRHWSGRAAVRRYPTCKVRSCSRSLLEWPWGDTLRPRSEKPQQDGRHWSISCAVLGQLWGDTPYPGAKEKHQQDVEGVNSHLKSSPIPARDSQKAPTNLVHTRTQGPQETEIELCLSVSCGGTGQQRTAAGPGALGAADLGMA